MSLWRAERETVQPQWLSESGPEATPAIFLTIPLKYTLQDKASRHVEGGSGVLRIHSELKSRLTHLSVEGRGGGRKQIRYAQNVTEVAVNQGCSCKAVRCA